MKHFAKSIAEKLSNGDHFRKRYFKIHDGVDLSNFKPQIMNYSNMAMVWAEIMLHMDVD
jgi:hypothetical protein